MMGTKHFPVIVESLTFVDISWWCNVFPWYILWILWS